MAPNATEIGDLLKPLLLKDLRIQCRVRGLNPGGSRETLVDRITAHMLETGDLSLAAEFNGEVSQVAHALHAPTAAAPPAPAAAEAGIGVNNNNYLRPQGQNTGNFITDKPSSRVLAPPGGGTHFSLADGSADTYAPPPARSHGATATVSVAGPPRDVVLGAPSEAKGNNYTRPQGQNVGNFITDKPSSRVLAPPGGGTQITFG